jgi:hypothetical protein
MTFRRATALGSDVAGLARPDVSLLFTYKAIEGLCGGVLWFLALVGLLSCVYLRRDGANESDVSLFAGLPVDRGILLFSYVALRVVVVYRAWRWVETSGASPWQRATGL